MRRRLSTSGSPKKRRRWAEPVGRAGRRGCVHITPDLTRQAASDKSFSCLTSLPLKRDRRSLPSAPTPSIFPCSSPPTLSWPLLLPDKERLEKRWMEMTRWLWRDCHPVMHWEPSPAFCGSHTDETVTPRHAGSRTLEGQRTEALRGKLGHVGWWALSLLSGLQQGTKGLVGPL